MAHIPTTLSLNDLAFLGKIQSVNQYGSITAGLVARWQLNGNLLDPVGGYNGSINEPPITYVSGIINEALSLPGNQYVTTGCELELGNFTCCAWFYITAVSWTGYSRLVDKNYISGFWMGTSNTLNSMEAGIMQTSSPYGTVISGASTNTWMHLALTRSGTTGTVYLNGTQNTVSATVSSNTLDPSQIDIGAYTGFNGDNPWIGYVEDVRLYNVALTSSQINQIAALQG
jgi:hypothetical protein